jgi:hypothetical protein
MFVKEKVRETKMTAGRTKEATNCASINKQDKNHKLSLTKENASILLSMAEQK